MTPRLSPTPICLAFSYKKKPAAFEGSALLLKAAGFFIWKIADAC